MNNRTSGQPSQCHLLFVAFAFPPVATASVHRSVRFVRYLTELGWRITVLTLQRRAVPATVPIDEHLVNKIPAGVRIEATSTWMLKQQLLRLRQPFLAVTSWRTGTELTNTGIPAGDGNGRPAPSTSRQYDRWQRTKDLFTDIVTIPDQEIGWLPHAVARARKMHRQDPFDIIFSTAPPFTSHLIGMRLKRLTKRPWVADFRDAWVRAPWKHDEMQGTLRGALSTKLERRMVKTADRVILNTHNTFRDFQCEYGRAAAEHFHMIPNGFDPSDFLNMCAYTKHPNPKMGVRTMVLTHTGALYRKRNPTCLLKAAGELLDEQSIRSDELQIHLVGTGCARFASVLQDHKQLSKVVKLQPPVAHAAAIRLQLESDVLLLVQPETADAVPGKLYEYVRTGRPILALTDEGATADLVRKYRLGEVVAPCNIDEIKQALLRLLRQHRNGGISTNARSKAIEAFDGRVLTGKLHQVLQDCMS